MKKKNARLRHSQKEIKTDARAKCMFRHDPISSRGLVYLRVVDTKRLHLILRVTQWSQLTHLFALC